MKDSRQSIRVVLDKLLKDEEFVPYAHIIRKLIKAKGGKYAIESVEDVEKEVKKAFNIISEIRSADVKAEICADLKPLTELELFIKLCGLQKGIIFNMRLVKDLEDDIQKSDRRVEDLEGRLKPIKNKF